MADHDRIAGLSAQLSELGQHLAYRSPASGGRREYGEERAAQASAPQGRRTERDDVLRDLDRELALLREARSFLTVSLPPNDPRLRDLDVAESQLTLLRDSASAGGAVNPDSIRQQMKDATRSAEGAINAATSIAATTGSTGILMTRMAAQEQYDRSMSAIERRVGEIMREDAQSFGQTARLADRFGIDISPYHAQRDALLREAEEKEKQGDRYGAITAKTLNVWNTYYSSQEVADAIDGDKYPAEKAAAQKKADDNRIQAERAEQDQRKAAQDAAAKAADGMTFAGGDAERDAWIKAKVDKDMDAYHDRKASMDKPKSLSADQARAVDSVRNAALTSNLGEKSEAQNNVNTGGAEKGADLAFSYARQYAGFAEGEQTPYQHDAVKLPAAAQEEAKKAAAPVAQDTANAATKDAEPKLPSSTPVVQVAEAAKSSVTI